MNIKHARLISQSGPAGTAGTQSLRRALEILRMLSTHTSSGWRLTDLSVGTGLDHTTVHRLLKCMIEEGMASRCPGTRRYTLGPLAYELGLAASPYFSIDSVAGQSLAKLAASTRTIVFLNLRSGYDSVCIARHDGQKALMAYTVHVGTRRPLCLSAGGVAIWVKLPQRLRTRIRTANLHAIEHSGQARQASVQSMLAESERLGFGLNRGNIIPGITAIGVPIRNANGEAIASLSLAFEDMERLDKRRDAFLERLYREVEAIESTLPLLRY
ncbi:MAG TPA: IclR family transcriptional regulator [Castellaniella sp.]|nr:IclR family transcriptional regulator [Castellaniella sp.]